jgi:hypothetical protein
MSPVPSVYMEVIMKNLANWQTKPVNNVPTKFDKFLWQYYKKQWTLLLNFMVKYIPIYKYMATGYYRLLPVLLISKLLALTLI